MSDQEREDILPEPAPGQGHELGAAKGASEPPQNPEDRLVDQLGETADAVTQGLRDLQDELSEPMAEQRVEIEAPPVDTAGATTELPAEPPPPDVLSASPTFAAPPADGYQSPKGGATFTPEGTSDDRMMAALAWLSMVILQLPIVSVIQLLSSGSKNQPFQRHHAVTSLLFYAAGIVYEILAVVVFTILTAVTLGCGALCLWVIFFVPHALGLYYAFQAYSGKRLYLPFLTKFAQDQGWM